MKAKTQHTAVPNLRLHIYNNKICNSSLVQLFLSQPTLSEGWGFFIPSLLCHSADRSQAVPCHPLEQAAQQKAQLDSP